MLLGVDAEAGTTNAPLVALAVITDYESLHAALRARADALGVSRATLDDACGVADGYIGKLLCTPPLKYIGPISLGRILAGLGVTLVMTEDPAAREQLAALPRRHESQVRRPKLAWPSMPFKTATGRAAHALWMAKVSPARRKQIARKAARARWRKARESGAA